MGKSTQPSNGSPDVGDNDSKEQQDRIVVIGAGIIGVLIAYHLALRGAHVTVLDKEVPGSGCTQGAFAMLIASHTDSTAAFNTLYQLAVEEWRQFETLLNESLPIQWGGVVNWAEPGENAKAIATATERLKSWGVKADNLVEEDISRLVPGAIPGSFGAGSFLPDHGAVDIARTFDILLRHTKALGVTFQTPVVVTDIKTKSNGKSSLSTSDGQFDADKIVIAAGAGTSDLARMVGSHIPVNMVSGTLAYSKPMPLLLHRILNGPLGSIRQNQDGRIVTGADYRPGADGQDVSDGYGQLLMKRVVEVIPALAGIELDSMTVGYVPIPVDTHPIVGFCDSGMTIYVATMMSGITMAPLMGRLAATEILGQSVSLLESYRPSRFTL